MRTSKYVLLYLLLIELMLPFIVPFIVPLQVVYEYRLNYELLKNKTANLDFVLDKIEQEIKNRGLHDYIIILGDSVAYSGPVPAQESIGADMEKYYKQDGKQMAVFNLAMPAMQVGDLYTMLLKLDEHGISSDKVILNIIYAGFAERKPDPAIVFWLGQDLARLDPASYQHTKPGLEAAVPKENPALRLNRFLTDHLAIFRYRLLLKSVTFPWGMIGEGAAEPADQRPWYQKPGLKKALTAPDYQKGFSVKPFDMSSDNLQIYFLDKIMQHQQGKQTLVFLAAVNPELFEQVESPGYQENLQRVKQYFAGQDVAYLDFHGQIKQDLFSDHIHLTSQGYAIVAQRLEEVFHTGVK